MSHYDAIVLGAGGVGSAAMYQLARRGLRVLGLDRFPGGHDRGSSHGQTRIIRQAYFEHSDYTPLLQRTYALWAEIESRLSEQLFHRVGLLEVGPPDGVVVPGVLRSAEQHDLEVERLAAAEVEERFPGFRVPDGCVGVFERDAGYLKVERCVLAQLQLAVSMGAEHRSGVTIRGWQPSGGGYEVLCDTERFAADRLVIAGGAWATQLLPDLNLPLRCVRKNLHWYATADQRYAVEQGCPTYFYETGQGYFYGFPSIDALGVKAAEHSGGVEVADPLEDDRAEEPLDVQRITAFWQDFLPGVSSERTRRDVCFYTMTPDEHFVVDRHPAHSGVAFAAGLSGHGFKFAPALGEILADLTIDGSTTAPIGFLAADRFSGR